MDGDNVICFIDWPGLLTTMVGRIDRHSHQNWFIAVRPLFDIDQPWPGHPSAGIGKPR
jgi:hypothetical protein